MDTTHIFLQELTEDVSPPNHELQRRLFDEIRNEDLEKVKSLSKLKCDLNCLNNSGKTPLQVAADLKDVFIRNDMIRTLLSGGADLELALLQAVRDSSTKSVEILLPFREHAPEPSPRAEGSLKCQACVTPLILAAHSQNFQIVRLLLKNGYTIYNPKVSQKSSVSEGMVSEKLGPALYRLNGYRALASPVYIAASFLQDVQSGPDPVHRTCVLNKELREMAEHEYEFRNEYIELSDGCKEFAVALLKECHSTVEIRCVMEMKDEEGILCNIKRKRLNVMEFAIVTRNEKVHFLSLQCY